MKRFFRDNGLTIVMLGLFVLFWGGQSVAGWLNENQERQQHGKSALGWGEYVRSSDFLEATFENWESEFFQMAAFIILSAVLIQRGAAESKKPPGEEEDEHDKDPALARRPDSPGPVHRGGLALALYSRSLSLALALLFVVSFALHAVAGAAAFNEQALEHGGRTVSVWRFLGSPTFWFQSLQNWQSEFLSVAALVVLSIFLRQRGSPESKPVHAAHAQTGS